MWENQPQYAPPHPVNHLCWGGGAESAVLPNPWENLEQVHSESGSSWMYFLVSAEDGFSVEENKHVGGFERGLIEKQGLCRSWRHPPHIWQILESPGESPSEEGTKSDTEHGKSGEWVTECSRHFIPHETEAWSDSYASGAPFLKKIDFG